MLQNFNTDLFNDNDNVLIGLSGGADSTALLLNLLELKEKKNLNVFAVHINHCLRGEESDRDEKFCLDLCKSLGVEIFVERVDVNSFCKENGLSCEEGARILRYKAFEKYRNNGLIATAHNLSDNAETVLFNLSRGTGLKGLCGIPFKRENIVRPMLSVSREEILEYLKEKNQGYVLDSTNLSTDFSRNKIRNEILPKLCEINSSVCSSIKNTSDILKDEEDFLDFQAKKALNECEISNNKLNAKKLYENHVAIRRRVLIEFLNQNEIKISFKRIDEIEKACRNSDYYKNNVTNNVYLLLKRGNISIVEINEEDFENKLVIGNNEFIDKFVDVCIIKDVNKYKDEIVNKKFAIHYLDYDKIQGDIVLRNRRKGDRIRFEGKNFTTSVKKMFNEKVSIEERNKIAFICDELGIIFIESFGISDRVKIDNNTKTILRIEVKDRS